MAGAETAIVWDAHLGGTPVCLIGIESRNVPREGYRPARRPRELDRRHAVPAVVEEGRARDQRGERQPPGGRARQSLGLRRLARIDAQAAARVRRRDRARGRQLRGPDLVRGRLALPRRRLRGVLAGAEPRPARRRAGGLLRLGDRRRARGDRRLRARGARAGTRRRARGGARAPAARRARARQRASASSACSRRSRSRSRRELAAEFDPIHTVERARSVGSLSAIVPPAEMRAFLVREIGAKRNSEPQPAE